MDIPGYPGISHYSPGNPRTPGLISAREGIDEAIALGLFFVEIG